MSDVLLSARLEDIGEVLHDAFPEMIALYLFGSRASGNARADSDIDLAMLTAPWSPCSAPRFFTYYASVTAFLQTDKIDLIWLNQAKLSLQWEIVRTGELLFCCDARAVAAFVEETTRMARDLSYYSRLGQGWYSAFLVQAYLQSEKQTMVDRRRIMQKIDYIRNTCRPALQQLATLSEERFVTDPIALGATKYYLHSAVEAMLDIANHIVSRQGLGTFETHAQTFGVLVAHGILQRERLTTYRQMIGLRNRLVHLYEDVDPIVLYRVVTQSLEDFDPFIADITRLLIAAESTEGG
jgi:uncharacterized protein YutE (UPF0331/DUF86 family)/predicted nucleotidyltransferase